MRAIIGLPGQHRELESKKSFVCHGIDRLHPALMHDKRNA